MIGGKNKKQISFTPLRSVQDDRVLASIRGFEEKVCRKKQRSFTSLRSVQDDRAVAIIRVVEVKVGRKAAYLYLNPGVHKIGVIPNGTKWSEESFSKTCFNCLWK